MIGLLCRPWGSSRPHRLALLLGLASAFLVAQVVTGAVPADASGTKLTHTQATARLRSAGITWSSSGNCSDRANPRCTSFDGINSGTIDGIVAFKKASGCAIRITGGTEAGHASGTYSHGNGFKVDIAPRACVDNRITKRYTRIANRSGDGAPQYRSPSGHIYADERGNGHWDILYS